MEDGHTLEDHYQLVVKGRGVLGHDTWRAGKGKAPVGQFTGDELYLAYRRLWEAWARAHPALMGELREQALAHQGVLSDRFASSPVNQARALSDLLNLGF